MSAKEQLDQILPQTGKELKGRNYVAILGLSGVGKTVLVTLLSNALDHHFLGVHPDITANISSGKPFLEKCENSMLDGEFPPRTQPLKRDEIVIEMDRKGVTGTPTKIRFPDISGEDFESMMLGGEIEGADRVLKVFDMSKAKGKSHGDMSYVVYADMYLILLDCKKLEQWPKMARNHAMVLQTIRDFKGQIDETRKGKTETPIGIILTKSDMLPDSDQDTSELLKTHMKPFMNTIDSVHKGGVEFFKCFVDVQRNTDNEIPDPENLKVKVPLTYSHDEYVRLLQWIHENISG